MSENSPSTPDSRAPSDEVLERLAAAMPEPRTELDYSSPWHLLVATILSAQSTDKTINQVMPDLIDRWPTPEALADANAEEVEEVIHSTGFFRRKTARIQGAARVVRDDFGGRVPKTLDELVTLPGVARKTANLVLGEAFGIAAGFVVDTHARRVAQRLGFTSQKDPDKVEADLRGTFDPEDWIAMSHRLILHGRYVCTARRPACTRCPLNELCLSREAEAEGEWELRAEAEGRRVDSRGDEPLA